jgi:hypothetical protein
MTTMGANNKELPAMILLLMLADARIFLFLLFWNGPTALQIKELRPLTFLLFHYVFYG